MSDHCLGCYPWEGKHSDGCHITDLEAKLAASEAGWAEFVTALRPVLEFYRDGPTGGQRAKLMLESIDCTPLPDAGLELLQRLEKADRASVGAAEDHRRMTMAWMNARATALEEAAQVAEAGVCAAFKARSICIHLGVCENDTRIATAIRALKAEGT